MSDEKSVWIRVIDQILAWLKQVGGTAIVLGIIRFFKRKAWFAERKVEQAELKLKHHENEEKVENDNRNKSDIDIVRDAIREGGGGDSRHDSND